MKGAERRRRLEGGRMSWIFDRLDPNERLPRELILEGKRQRRVGMRWIELGAVYYLPALMLAGLLLGFAGRHAPLGPAGARVTALGVSRCAPSFVRHGSASHRPVRTR